MSKVNLGLFPDFGMVKEHPLNSESHDNFKQESVSRSAKEPIGPI